MFKIKNDDNEVLLEGEDYTELVQKMFLMIEYGNVKERLSIFDENRKITLISLSKKLNINLIPLINNKKIEYLKNNFSKDTLFSIIKDDGTVVDEFYNLERAYSMMYKLEKRNKIKYGLIANNKVISIIDHPFMYQSWYIEAPNNLSKSFIVKTNLEQ